MPLIRTLLLLLFYVFIPRALAQKVETTKQDSTAMSEALLLKEQQQQRIDSLVKQQLKKRAGIGYGEYSEDSKTRK